MSLEKHVNKIDQHLDKIGNTRAEMDFNLSVLRLWEHAQKTIGKDPRDIKAFSFRPEFLSQSEKRQNNIAAAKRKPPVYCDKNWHNCVRLKVGDLLKMPGIKRPIPPSHTPSEAKKVEGPL